MTYLSQLGERTRPEARRRLDVVADLLLPGSDASMFDWTSVDIGRALEVRDGLRARYAVGTANQHLANLRGVLKMCYVLGAMSLEQWQRLSFLKAIKGTSLPAGRHVSEDEFRVLFRMLADDMTTTRGKRDLALLSVARSTGARREELCSLQVGDVDLKSLTVRIENGKGDKAREVCLAKWCRSPLLAWLRVRGTGDGALFCKTYHNGAVDREYRELSTAGLNHLLKELLAKLGVEHFTWHDLRRSLAGDWFERGVDIVLVQRQLGHSSVATTGSYDRRPLANLRKAAQVTPDPFTTDGGAS